MKKGLIVGVLLLALATSVSAQRKEGAATADSSRMIVWVVNEEGDLVFKHIGSGITVKELQRFLEPSGDSSWTLASLFRILMVGSIVAVLVFFLMRAQKENRSLRDTNTRATAVGEIATKGLDEAYKLRSKRASVDEVFGTFEGLLNSIVAALKVVPVSAKTEAQTSEARELSNGGGGAQK